MQTEPYNPTMPFSSVRKLADADFPTRWGQFRILGFEATVAAPEPCNDTIPAPAVRIESAIALVMGDINEPGEDGKYISDSAGKGRIETIRRQKSPLRSPTEFLPTHPTRRSAVAPGGVT